MTRQTIGAFLATQRKAHGYTQEEVADKLGISNRTLSKWETDRSSPDILYLPALADLYGVTVDEILRGERTKREEIPLSPEEQNKKEEQSQRRMSDRSSCCSPCARGWRTQRRTRASPSPPNKNFSARCASF